MGADNVPGVSEKSDEFKSSIISGCIGDRVSNRVPSESPFKDILFEWGFTAWGHLTEACWAHIGDDPLFARGVICPMWHDFPGALHTEGDTGRINDFIAF